MLQLATPQSNSPGGRLFNDFLTANVLDPTDPDRKKLSKDSEKLYEQIRNTESGPFKSLKAKSDVGWVACLKDAYPVMNNNMHMLHKLQGQGLVCGGGNSDQMMSHTSIVASIQKFLIGANIAILPAMYADVAVLSADFSEEVGRVKNGTFVVTGAS